jgi:hypothetical protein
VAPDKRTIVLLILIKGSNKTLLWKNELLTNGLSTTKSAVNNNVQIPTQAIGRANKAESLSFLSNLSTRIFAPLFSEEIQSSSAFANEFAIGVVIRVPTKAPYNNIPDNAKNTKSSGNAPGTLYSKVDAHGCIITADSRSPRFALI